jgi:hypothetical protein
VRTHDPPEKGFDGWRGDDPADLFRTLEREVCELRAEITMRDDSQPIEEDPCATCVR